VREEGESVSEADCFKTQDPRRLLAGRHQTLCWTRAAASSPICKRTLETRDPVNPVNPTLTMSLPAGRWPVRSTSGILMLTFSTDVPFLAAFRASSLAIACVGKEGHEAGVS
jgi:hypothetical protein